MASHLHGRAANATLQPTTRFYEADQSVVITTDASPYGIGGFVSVNGVVTEYFADHISRSDC